MKKILVVEDNISFKEMITGMLKQAGFETLEADNGETALQLARTQQPDLIISDVQMDNLNGFMLHEFLREDPSTVGIPLLLMTGKSLQAGAWRSNPTVGYLAKPFTLTELFHKVSDRLKSPPPHSKPPA